MLPAIVVDAALEAELGGARAWAVRHDLELIWCAPERLLRVVLLQTETKQPFYLQAQCDDYKALPPAWDWRDENWAGAPATHLSPNSQSTPFGGSMFIERQGRAIICAPFNRLAYGTHNGPHSDWGDPAQWLTAGGAHVRATTLGDMLQAILRDFRFTTGRMA